MEDAEKLGVNDMVAAAVAQIGEKISFRYDDNKIENFENIKKK